MLLLPVQLASVVLNALAVSRKSTANVQTFKMTTVSEHTFAALLLLMPTSKDNCGRAGNVCSMVSNAVSNTCVSGSCNLVCKSGTSLSDGQCVPTSSDPLNCGKPNNVCPTTDNGVATCSSGVCGIQCGFSYSLVNGKCTSFNNDVYNCGRAANVCKTPTNGASASCVNGQCSATCQNGFAFQNGVCQSTSDDVNNCGSLGNRCYTASNAKAVCSVGKCSLQCNTGYALSADGWSCMSTTDDVFNWSVTSLLARTIVDFSIVVHEEKSAMRLPTHLLLAQTLNATIPAGLALAMTEPSVFRCSMIPTTGKFTSTCFAFTA